MEKIWYALDCISNSLYRFAHPDDLHIRTNHLVNIVYGYAGFDCMSLSASYTQTALTIYIVNYLKSMLSASHWKRCLYGTVHEKLSPNLRDSIETKDKMYIKVMKHKCLHNESL